MEETYKDEEYKDGFEQVAEEEQPVEDFKEEITEKQEVQQNGAGETVEVITD